MSIVQFPSINIEYSFINNERVIKPKTRADYLDIVKRFLQKDDYEEILCSIMDIEYYNNSEAPLRAIVDSYFSFM